VSRIDASERMCRDLFGQAEFPIHGTDLEFHNIMKRFTYGEVYAQGNLDLKMRELITIVVLTTNQTLDELSMHVHAALNVGVTPVQIKEAVYQCAPYIGFSRVQASLERVNEVFKERNISLPVENQQQTTEENRYEKGLRTQKAIFGDIIDKMQESTPENQKHIQRYLSAYCFGDIYTRSGLDLRERELLTFCILCALGGCESQVRGHIQGNLNMGHTKETLVAALTQCLPHIGFPRTLNALACINDMIPENQE